MFNKLKWKRRESDSNDALQKFCLIYGNAENVPDYYKEEYLQFSRFMHSIFISRYGWIVDTGNFQTVNRQLMFDVLDKIHRHPLLWKIFFMVA